MWTAWEAPGARKWAECGGGQEGGSGPVPPPGPLAGSKQRPEQALSLGAPFLPGTESLPAPPPAAPTWGIRQEVSVVSDLPGELVSMHSPEVVAQRGVLHRDAVLLCELVDLLHYTVHVGELQWGVEELPVTSLQARGQKQRPVLLGSEPSLHGESPSHPHDHPHSPQRAPIPGPVLGVSASLPCWGWFPSTGLSYSCRLVPFHNIPPSLHTLQGRLWLPKSDLFLYETGFVKFHISVMI